MSVRKITDYYSFSLSFSLGYSKWTIFFCLSFLILLVFAHVISHCTPEEEKLDAVSTGTSGFHIRAPEHLNFGMKWTHGNSSMEDEPTTFYYLTWAVNTTSNDGELPGRQYNENIPRHVLCNTHD